MSSEKNTAKSMASRVKKAILYFLRLLSIEKLQESKIQTVVKKAVNKASKILNPSTPNNSLKLDEGISTTS
jgi:hypothetical protein